MSAGMLVVALGAPVAAGIARARASSSAGSSPLSAVTHSRKTWTSSRRRCWCAKRRPLAVTVQAVGSGGLSSSSNSSVGTGAFPAGKRRAEVDIPALLIDLKTSRANGLTEEEIRSAIAGGVTMVSLNDSAGDSGGGLYDAACRLKTLLRGRAVLLVSDRPDIAGAAGTDGVVLSNTGLPTIVARRMMQGVSNTDTSDLPLIARRVTSVEEGAVAAKEGADFIIFDVKDLSHVAALRQRVSIPVVVNTAELQQASTAMQQGADGLCLTLEVMRKALKQKGGLAQFVNRTPQRTSSPRKNSKAERHLLNKEAEAAIAEERALLQDVLKFLEQSTPQLPELSLMRSAVKQLDDFFLIVVVGEFNSGKSSFINALLGRRSLKEGILPTTNEICTVRYAASNKEERMDRLADGNCIQYVQADFLKDVNIVDTPGTNVVLERQQRLTEEFVPQSDLVLFCLSADRAMTESEVNFLRYIRQWGKKVVFVLNKIDVLETQEQAQEVVAFVKSNAQRLLGVNDAMVIPVSAKLAFNAKLSTPDETTRQDDPRWQASRFEALENFVFDFLSGKNSERIRLKLETPLAVAAALLEGLGRTLQMESDAASQELRTLRAVRSQLDQFKAAMSSDSAEQRKRVAGIIKSAAQRAEQFVDDTLQLGNIPTLARYVFAGKNASSPVRNDFDRDVVRGADVDVQQAVSTHGDWVRQNVENQKQYYMDFIRQRWGSEAPENQNGLFPDSPPRLDIRSVEPSSSMKLALLDTSAASLLLDEEMREAVVGTAGAGGGALAVSYLLTTVLQSTAEDLLALAVGGVAMWFGVLRLPLRRSETKQKLRRAADNFSDEIEATLSKELASAVDSTIQEVTKLLEPRVNAANADLERLGSTEQERQAALQKVEQMRRKVLSIGS
eukprot:jgi/Chlat1/8159/Chrsp76S07611